MEKKAYIKYAFRLPAGTTTKKPTKSTMQMLMNCQIVVSGRMKKKRNECPNAYFMVYFKSVFIGFLLLLFR